MTGNIPTLTLLGGSLLLTVVLAGCATPKTDEGDVSEAAQSSTPSSTAGTEMMSSGDSSADSGASGGATAGVRSTGRSAPGKTAATAKPAVKTTTGTKTTATKTDPGPDRDSAYGPKFTIDANGKVVPIKK